jgi:hypothetical protein
MDTETIPLIIAIVAAFLAYRKWFVEHPEDFKNQNKK